MWTLQLPRSLYITFRRKDYQSWPDDPDIEVTLEMPQGKLTQILTKDEVTSLRDILNDLLDVK